MFPYKIRKPAWGSSRPGAVGSKGRGGGDAATRSRDDEDDDDAHPPPPGGGGEPSLSASVVADSDPPDDPHVVGGNLQHAILSDIVDLRSYYRRRRRRRRRSINSDDGGGGGGGGCASSFPTTCDDEHDYHVSFGSSFAIFGDCYRDMRLGAMHTRTIPPRVDRGEYVQLLYSCCFHLLEASFGRHPQQTNNVDDDDDDVVLRYDDANDMNDRDISDAIYSIFALYALHKTNVLPMAPNARRVDHHAAARARSGKIIDESSLGKAWSMLPIGINSDEDKLYRRTYRSPVRIDRHNYALLLRLRDICLARVERCGLDAMMMAGTKTTTTNVTDGTGRNGRSEDHRRRCCYCGEARDAAHIIDAMLSDDSFFDYCEYHGPVGLEGLCGSPNFYGAYFACTPKKRKGTNGPKNKTTTATDRVASVMKKIELNAIGNDDGILESLDLQSLSEMVEGHCSNLNSVITNLRLSRFTDGILQPKQREQVENTLSGIVSRPTYVDLVDRLNVEKSSRSNSCDASMDRSDAKLHPEIQPAESNRKMRLKFPANFSPFCDIDVTNEARLIRKAVAREKRARLKGETTFVDADTQLDDFLVLAEYQKGEIFTDDDVLTSTTVQHRKRRRRELDNLSELQQEGASDEGKSNYTVDEVSIATGSGKKALLSLLSIPKDDDDENDEPADIFLGEDDFSIATGAGKNALLSLLSMAETTFDSDHLEDEYLPIEGYESDLRSLESSLNNEARSATHDDASVMSGIGKRALQFLLTGHADDRPSQPAKRRANKKAPAGSKMMVQQKPVKMKKPKTIRKRRLDDSICAEYDTDASSDGEFSVPMEDAGRNALAALLSCTTTADV